MHCMICVFCSIPVIGIVNQAKNIVSSCFSVKENLNGRIILLYHFCLSKLIPYEDQSVFADIMKVINFPH